MLIRNLLYILQSESYDTGRFLRFAYSHLKWWNLEKRQKISWTPKIKLLYLLSYLLLLAVAIEVLVLGGAIWLLAIIVIEIIFLPILISLSAWLVKPADFYFKNKIIKRATKILADKKITVVGITGSYGKTSAKEILYAILSEQFTVLKTPENINTDIGIASFVLQNLKDEKILIAEMGAYYPGDIKKICEFIKPDYSILTGINESHLDRFNDIDNTIKEKFSLPANTKKLAILNFDDENIHKNHEKLKVSKYKGISKSDVTEVAFLDDFNGIQFNYLGENFQCGLLAEHNISLILLCMEIAKELGIGNKQIKKSVAKISPIKHRLSPIYNSNSNIWVIDDSYNGNKDGFKSGIKVLSRAKGRKVVLTPGLVELGEKTKIIHNEIGEMYAQNVDLVLLIKNKVSQFIIEGMKKNNFKNYIVYKSTEEAHNDLKNILKSGDTIIFQNDWTDNYF